MQDLNGKNIQSYLVKRVVGEIRDVFNITVNSARGVLGRLMVHLPTAKGAVPRAVLEGITVTRTDIPILERFFEAEYHREEDRLIKDLITIIENWVIQRLEAKWTSGEKANLMQFLVELGQEQMTYYAKWDDRKVVVENQLRCREDLTDFLPQDLQKVNSLNLPGKIGNHDKENLATLYHIAQEKNCDLVFATVDYYIVAARSLIESGLGLTVSDPLYVMQRFC